MIYSFCLKGAPVLCVSTGRFCFITENVEDKEKEKETERTMTETNKSNLLKPTYRDTTHPAHSLTHTLTKVITDTNKRSPLLLAHTMQRGKQKNVKRLG